VTEVLPQPRAATGAVFIDHSARTLTVRLSELESGYLQTLWRSGWTALRRAQEAGWPPGGPGWVWADAPGSYQEVHGIPVDGGALAFTWPVGTPGFGDLVGKPGLAAIVTMDVNTHWISTVRFLHKPA
jgi:hypothetical protein